MSLWFNGLKSKFEPLSEDLDVDICIVGGGITGITTAYLLAKAGKSVCILERDNICAHATGNTTAKITAQHGLFYNYLLNTFSTDIAKGYLDANLEAISNIKNIIDEENIDCDFEFCDNYVFTNLESDIPKIKQEVLTVNSLGFNAELVNSIEVPVDCLSAIKFPNQAKFNPLKYVNGLLNKFTSLGGMVFEHSLVHDVKQENNFYHSFSNDFCVSSKYIVFACHYPFINVPGLYFLKMYQEASYVIGFKTSANLFDGMYINTQAPIISLRTALDNNNEQIVLLGGSNHKVGTDDDISNSFLNLENLAKNMYPDAQILYRWQTQDCISLDKIPYIGPFSSVWKNSYIATGFKKWGMTTSNVSANIICDSILGNKNKYDFVFTSTRFNPIKNGTEFVNLLKQSVNSLVVDRIKIPNEVLSNIPCNSAKIVDYLDSKVGIYRDTNNILHAIKPFCSHLGCQLSWNDLAKTWDCPCHGSRFTFDGKSLYDPSVNDLKSLILDEN